MAAARWKFDGGIAMVCEVQAAAMATNDLIDEAWAALRTGVVVARKLEDSLDSRSAEEMSCVLDFMLQTAGRKRVARAQVKECLRILLARPPWLAAARAERGLRGGAHAALDGEQDEALRAQLDVEEVAEEAEEHLCVRLPAWLAGAQTERSLESGACAALDGERDVARTALLAVEEAAEEAEERAAEDPEQGEPTATEKPFAPPTPPQEPLRRAVAAAGEPEAAPQKAAAPLPEPAATERRTAPARPPAVRECPAERVAWGREVLQRFGWQFPWDPLGTRGDEATEGFQAILEAVTLLTTPSGKALAGGRPCEALAALEGDWLNLLQFLVSMYTSGVRRAFASRVRYLAAHLRALSPAFRRLAPWKSLPWGHLPPARQEVEAEAKGPSSEEGVHAAERALSAPLCLELVARPGGRRTAAAPRPRRRVAPPVGCGPLRPGDRQAAHGHLRGAVPDACKAREALALRRIPGLWPVLRSGDVGRGPEDAAAGARPHLLRARAEHHARLLAKEALNSLLQEDEVEKSKRLPVEPLKRSVEEPEGVGMEPLEGLQKQSELEDFVLARKCQETEDGLGVPRSWLSRFLRFGIAGA